MRTVLTFTTSDRLAYAARTFDAWSRVRGTAEIPVIFSCEPHEPMAGLCGSVAFQRSTIDFNSRWLGNELNSYKALQAGFDDGAEFVIQAEDDVLVSTDILEYLTWAAREYAADESVLSVTGFQNARRGGTADVFRRQWFTPQVWGMWRRSWDQVRDRWPAGPTPHSWDWYLCEHMKTSGMVQVEPCQTRCQHIGVTGAHGSHPEHLAREWDAQQFLAEIPVQSYREITSG